MSTIITKTITTNTCSKSDEKRIEAAVLFTAVDLPRGSKSMQQNNDENGQLPDESSTHHHLNNNHHLSSVTAVLNYCKNKILNPYLRLLSIVGLRSLFTDYREFNVCFKLLNYGYVAQMIAFLIVGYCLQYMACFRRDRGFCYDDNNNDLPLSRHNHNNLIDTNNDEISLFEQICHGSVLFSFIAPSCLHFVAYLHGVIHFRNSGDDQLPVLMERVFLSSSTTSSSIASQRKLIRTLWIFVAVSGTWMVLSFIAVNVMMASGKIHFKWFYDGPHTLIVTLKILLVVCTLWHDIVQATVISSYCLQTELLTSYLQFLHEKLLQFPVQPLEWMRDIEEFKKMLKYINNEIAPSVCLFTMLNLCYGISGLVWMFKYDSIEKDVPNPLPNIAVLILNVSLWIVISLAPFVQAARLSNACEILRNAGQEVRIRPFVHQDTPIYELDSILLYTISLKLYAKLYCVPITIKYLCLFLTITGVCILILGQCHYLN